MSTVSVSHDEERSGREQPRQNKPGQERMQTYATYSSALAYPDERFFDTFPQLIERKEKIILEYDALFRGKGIWLDTTEHVVGSQFQKSRYLSDIMGFYRAFGLQIEKERPDSLSVELEFMHYLIFKAIYAASNKLDDFQEKVRLCREAQQKFFAEYLYPGAQAIAAKISSERDADFYSAIFDEMLLFLNQEKNHFDKMGQKAQ